MNNRIKAAIVLISIMGNITVPVHAADAPAPGYGNLGFSAPAPGSYQLPSLGLAADGKVVNTAQQDLNLYDLLSDKVVLLSFIYSTCSDANGCPLATLVLHKIKTRLKQEPALANKLRLITLSFNPEQDTPAVMQQYSQSLQGSGVEWQFLTTRSEQAIQAILQHYPQNTQKVYDAQGSFTGTYSHRLRVYLIDKNKQLRNIYSVDFLHPDTLINDVKTLLMETTPKRDVTKTSPDKDSLYRAGDNKNHYEQSSYQTQSIALLDRKGQAIDLLAMAQQSPLGLPPLPVPADNPLSAAKINLGRKLFYDRRLSFNKTFSCAMCHIAEQGFTSNEMATSVGVEGRTVRRNAPTLYNVAYADLLFHDGRETSLEQQVWGPLLAHNEMANPSIGHVISKIQHTPDYKNLFEAAFNRPVSMETVGMAIASYERTLNAADTPFDRWHYGKQANAIHVDAQHGYQLFIGKAGCSQCHTLTQDNALLTDQQLHNTGIGYAASMAKTPETRKIQIAPGVFADVASATLQTVAEPKTNDLGQYEITQNPAHRWRYKTPSLRNVALTAPYMHDGSLANLTEVINFYNRGGIANENLDPRIKPLHLNTAEINDLVAFLQVLTGSNVPLLVGDAFAAPVGEVE